MGRDLKAHPASALPWQGRPDLSRDVPALDTGRDVTATAALGTLAQLLPKIPSTPALLSVQYPPPLPCYKSMPVFEHVD